MAAVKESENKMGQGQWGKTDTANAMPIWVGSKNKRKETNANRTAAHGNTSPNIWGTFVVNTAEAQANPNIAHAGIIARRVGSGNRSGRVQTEVLIAASTYGVTDSADDAVIPNARVTFPNNFPANLSVAAPAAANIVTSPVVKPAGVALTYLWEISVNGGTTWTTVTNAGIYTGATTNTLALSNSTGLNNNRYRVTVTPVAGAAKTSRAMILTVT